MKYGFLGCGNMGGAIARALSNSTKDITLADISGINKTLAAELGVSHADNAFVAANCDRIFLAVKPHLVKGCLAPLQDAFAARKPLIVTTNLTLQELKHPDNLAKARIYDRVLERCTPILVNDQNIRKLNTAANMEKAKSLLEGVST